VLFRSVPVTSQSIAGDRSGRRASPGGDISDGAGISRTAGLQVKGQRSRSTLNDERPVESYATMTGVRLAPAVTEPVTPSAVLRPPTSTHSATNNANGMQYKQPEQPEALCAFNCCCCCTGKLLLMWLKVGDIASVI